MLSLWNTIQRGYLRVIEPVADWLVRRRVHPNTITTIGTICTVIAGGIFATGHIMTGGWFLGITALFDVLDGTVARRTGRSSTFGAFYDSTLDRVSDGVLMGGLVVFTTSRYKKSDTLLVITLLGLSARSDLVPARAPSLGIDAKVGLLQRPERITLLSAPKRFRPRPERVGACFNRHAAVGDRMDHRNSAYAVVYRTTTAQGEQAK
jgi:CDP-diacylglycerol--glycerol-3-phosphate 3-phosphatidyltransferase